MSESGSTAQSDVSSTLSEFVARRYAGNVPVFGGDPRVGAKELADAVTQSFQSIGLVDALTSLNAMVRATASQSKGLPPGIAERSPETVHMVDRSSVEGMEKAATLDRQKIRMLLEASMVESDDIDKFMTLLSVARDSMIKKSTAMRMNNERRGAAMRVDSHVSDKEVSEYFVGEPSKREGFEMQLTAWMIGREDEVPKGFVDMACRAIVHDSVFGGRCTNRKLAMAGDAAIKLMLIEFCVSHGIAVSDASSHLQATQSNMALRDVGVAAGLTSSIVAVPDIDPTSKRVMATAVEAIYGAAYMTGGMQFVRRVNGTPLRVFDFLRHELAFKREVA